ncbi:MAG: hypothetical protein AAF598_15340 [Bacteroidota bacterium]
MQFPWYQRLLSYVVPIRLEQLHGVHNPHLEVHLSKGRIQLSTANAIYSHEDLYSNFKLSFDRMSRHLVSINNMLILGFGLGSIPNMLEKHFKQQIHYTAVDIDETILSLAYQYNIKFLESAITSICADASLFVEQCQETFDMVCIDLFMDDQIPVDFSTQDFLEQVQHLIPKHGWILYNCLGAKKEDIQRSMAFFEGPFRTVFPEAIYLEVDRNFMLINRPID